MMEPYQESPENLENRPHWRGMKPPCSEWKIWTGPEVEGTVDHGQLTVFVRDLGEMALVEVFNIVRAKNIQRIFFTEDFKNWPVIRDAFVYFEKTCVATHMNDFIPKDILLRARIYVQKPMIDEHFLKPGDQVCVGQAYAREFFEVGKGIKAKPEDYMNDEKVL